MNTLNLYLIGNKKDKSYSKIEITSQDNFPLTSYRTNLYVENIDFYSSTIKSFRSATENDLVCKNCKIENVHLCSDASDLNNGCHGKRVYENCEIKQSCDASINTYRVDVLKGCTLTNKNKKVSHPLRFYVGRQNVSTCLPMASDNNCEIIDNVFDDIWVQLNAYLPPSTFKFYGNKFLHSMFDSYQDSKEWAGVMMLDGRNLFLNGSTCGFYCCLTETYSKISNNDKFIGVEGNNKVAVSGVTLPGAVAEFYVKNKKGLAVEYIGSCKVDMKGEVSCAFDISDLNEELQSISVLITSEEGKNETYGFIECPIIKEHYDYYVKENGSGDGSSWDNAMGPETFATILPIVGNGTTFHIAGGRYLPIKTKEEYSTKNLLYTIKSDVKIIGGYDPDELDETAANDPIKYHTVFTTDPSGDNTYVSHYINDPSKDDIGSSTGIFTMPGAKNVTFDGVEFIGCSSLKGDFKVNLNISRCTFKLTNRAVTDVKNLTIDNCLFTQMAIGSSPSTFIGGVDGDFVMSNSTVTEVTGTGGYVLSADYETHHATSMTLVNNTFAGNSGVKFAGFNSLINTGYSNCKIYNNTFVNNLAGSNGVIEGNPSGLEFVGNLIIANEGVESISDAIGNLFFDEDDDVIYGNNLYDFEGYKGDLQTKEEYLVNFVDGTYESGVFKANLNKNGGYTPTVALKAISDGHDTNIRFPKTATIVDKDQRGVTRLSSTCPGAYEVDNVEVNENLELKSAIAKVYGTECTNGEGFLDVSWARKTYNANQQFKLVVKNEDEKVFEGPLQDMSKGSGTFQISGLKPGTYTYSFYIKKEGSFVPANKFNISFQYQFNTTVGEVPSGDKFIVKYVKPSIPNPQVNKSSIKVSKPYCYSQTGNGSVQLKIGNWVDGCKAYFYKGEKELWSVDALDSPNNNYNLKVADNAVEDLYNGARHVDSVVFNYSGLSGGSYSFVLEDLCGNKTTTPITIDPIEKPSFVVSKSSKTELSCYNSTDGSIEITLVGGELELCGKVSSYDIKGLEFTEKNRTVKATGLTPGSYRFVYGTTAKMCSDNADTTIVITAPDTVKAKCDFKDAYCAEIGGSATFTAEGGVGNYSVTISDISGNVFKKESFAGKNTVTVGGMKLSTTYSAVVEDANGCQAKQLSGIRFWLKEVPHLNTSLTPSNETCYNENNGRVKLTYSGNNNKDELVVSAIGSDGKPHNAYFSETEGSVLIEDLAPGEYTVKLDFGAEGCNTPGDNATTIGKVTIGKVDKPTLLDVSDETVIRCKGRTLSRKIEVTNYNKKLYTWKLTKDGEDITSKVDATVPTTEDGEFVFKGLTAGDYVFSLVDQCGNPFSKSFTVLESLKKTMKVVDNSGGVSCEGKSDAYFDINVTNWNTGDKCSITNAETGEELEVSKTTKGTYISFFTYHLPGGKYNVDVTDLCGTTYPTVVVDLDELGKESKFGLSLAEAASDAECNEDSRKISATVTGRETGSTYSYTLYQVTGEGEKVIDDKQKEVADKTYTSGKLDYGTYKLAAVTSEGCEASVERTFTASHTLTGTRLLCGENTHVELSYDGVIEGVSVLAGGKWADVKFAEGADKSSFDYSGIVTDVQVKESGCTTAKKLTDYDVSSDLFKGVTTKYTSTDETCHNKKDGSVSVTYSGYKGNMQIVAYAVDADGVKTTSIYDEKSKSLLISDLVPGTYDIELGFSINGCEVSGQTLSVKKALVIKSVEKPTLAMDNSTLTIRCEEQKKSVLVNVTNYNKELYTWQLTKDGEDISSSAKVSAPSASEGAFVLGNLTAGSYAFSLVDQCNELYTKKFKITENIKKPLEFSTHHQGISCEGMADGVINFSVSNWTVNEDKYVLTNTQTKETIECPNPFYKGGTITFTLTGISSGTYSFVATDLCGTEYPAQIADFEELNKSSKFGLTLDEAASDAECNEDSRKISATVSGLENQSPYTYVLYKVDGEKDEVIDDQQKEVTDRTYTSEKLDYGKYKLVAVNNNGCEAAVTRTFTASHILTGTRLVCGENTHVELNYDGLIEGVSVKTGDKWSDIDFAEGADKSSFDCKGVVTDVRVKETGCYTVAALSDYEITGDLFEGVSAKATVTDQNCYGVNNGSVKVTYSGYKGKLQVVAYAINDNGDKLPSSYDPEEKCLVISNLAPGTYNVQLGFSIEGCKVSDQSLDVAKEVSIQALEKPEFLEDNYAVTHNQCENIGKGRMHLEMMGWAPDVYTWTIKRAGQTDAELKKHTHCGDKLPNGATAFDLWTLPEGENVFTMWDACGYKYTKTADIKADYVAPLTIDTVNSKAYSCEGRTDGRFTFVAWPWDIEDSAAVLKDGNIGLKDFKPEVKDGKAYFELKGQGAGVYTLVTTDLCGREESKENNFADFSAKNGRLTVGVDFDAEAAKCDVEERIFKVTATGGTAPYIYTITKGGATVQTTEATEKKSFNSQLLTDGTYVVTVTDKTDCKAVYDDDLTIKPSHTMKAKNRDVICGDIKQSLVYASIDNGTTLGLNYIAIDESGKEYLPLQDEWTQYGICTFELPTNVTLKGMIAKVDEQCSVYTDLEAMPLDESALAEAKVTIDTLIHQRCYGIDNAELWVDYSGPKTNYDMKLRLKNVDKPDEFVDTENKHGEKLQYKFENLAPGNYELYLVQAVGKCDAGLEPRKIQDISIKAIPHPFELIWDTVIQSTCYSKMNGNPAIEVHGWSEGNCTWELNKFNVDKGDYELEAKNTDAYPVSGDSAYWSSDHLDAGRYIISWTDYCHNTVLKKFEIEPLKEPSLKVLVSSNTDLKCSYDKAYVDFHYEGGAPVNKRILIKYIPVGSSDEDWDFTTEEIKGENTYRLYGFTPGSGNMGHKKAEGTDYVLTDEDKGLPDGKYYIFYEDTTKACNKDYGYATVEVQRPYVNMNLAKQDVLCLSEHTGVINIVPVRFGKNPVYYHYMDQYLDHYDIRDQGYNFGEEVFKNPEEQKKEFANREKFLSNEFSDVESISITAKSRTQEELYKLMKDSIAKRGTNLKYPLSKFYKNGGIDYAVSDWIGFNMMPADMYYVTVNDIYGCQYKDSIEVKGPEDALRVTEAKYPMGADPECNAEDRRIKFTCTGGYYPYFYNVVNKDDPKKDENDTSGSGMFGQDYVTGAVIEKYEENGKTFVDYTSKMLKSGTYEVSVVDKMGCIAKWEETINVKAKHALNAIPHVDLCDPTNDNKLELIGADHSNKYTLYVGHRSRCKYYPYCSVDDNNGGLQTVDGKKRHVHEYICEEDESPCVPYDNCIEHKEVNAGTINFKVQENKNWVKKSGYGIDGVPTGTIGLLATMSDGCTAFDEYTFVSSGLPTSLTQIAMDSVNCNGDSDGAITFGLYGGHGYYSRILLDGEDLINSHQNVLMREVYEEINVDEKTGKVIPTYTTTESLLSVKPNAIGLLNNKPLFEKLKKYYDGEALYDEAVKILKANGYENPGFTDISNTVSHLKKIYGAYQYFFSIDNLAATLNWEGKDKEKNKKHILTVVDEQECQTSMEFDIYQPTKLNLDIAASVICPDGSGRIYAESTTGGVPPYEYRMNEATNADFAAVFNANTGKKPKTYEGIELENPAAYESYYVDNYHVGDHIPAGKGQTHYMWVKDANGCEMKSSNGANLSEIWDWDKVEQDQLISTWHDYGDVLVVIDQTDYSMVHPSAEYDSMKVIVVMNSDDKNAYKFEGITQPKERFAFGVKECSFELDEGEIIEKCYSANTPFGDFDTPSWGIPSNAIARYDTAVAKGISLNPIHTYFHQLIPDEALRRMSFVKFQTKAGEEVNLKEMIGNKQDYHLNFLIRVVAYVGGCDIVTEHNPLVLNLQGDDPFPKANYKDVISVDAFPNPVAKDGKCTLKVTLSNNENEFSYAVYSLDGKRIRHYTVRPSDNCKVVEKADGNTDYIYEIVVDGLNETSIVKVTTETNTAAVKILVK